MQDKSQVINKSSENKELFISYSSSSRVLDLTFSGACIFNQTFKSWDLDRGCYNIYKALLLSETGLHYAHSHVYFQDNKIVKTIVAPCLDSYGYNLTTGVLYNIRGIITRDNTCGTAWEFNPLLAVRTESTKPEATRDGFWVKGSGKVRLVSKVTIPAITEGSYHQILVNHQPKIRIILPSSSLNIGPDTEELVGQTLEFCGRFIGEEIESGVIKLMVE
ncbi:uncharacterized protein PGTG_11149 [Puccinia graminis f. sp. tritici CRL 75-36-700-3]|uniref:Uncharacterized protein n=1 Tax=Puccinia graminis f. sp. tritici (strain CRL 75-36-700-3 / race SCCL) TaxID=418459 RepID=E3KL05_PUCGT|nr:uncharacterized protein PGTG_11149 [Puccinia graminis f. sp. tritici CRL 75-36-700-3]EFP84980.2 hypothetical protein PGTG_11149 [Puccinia graminis f. sp. tritici CRL 75-36-700-3]